jgi:hypothetical protein
VSGSFTVPCEEPAADDGSGLRVAKLAGGVDIGPGLRDGGRHRASSSMGSDVRFEPAVGLGMPSYLSDVGGPNAAQISSGWADENTAVRITGAVAAQDDSLRGTRQHGRRRTDRRDDSHHGDRVGRPESAAWSPAQACSRQA